VDATALDALLRRESGRRRDRPGGGRDLGHFHLHDGEHHDGEPLLSALLDGYRRIQPLPPGDAESIRGSAVLLGLRQLCRWLSPLRGLGIDHPVSTARAKRITQILDPRFFRGYRAFNGG
jgi:hypothetical protein